MSENYLEEIIYYLSNKCFKVKANSVIFDNIKDNEMEEIKKFLIMNPYLVLKSNVDLKIATIVTQNIIYDCKTDKIDDLLDWKVNWKNAIKSENHITINILNLQLIEDIKKLKLLNSSILKIHEKICFHLYTTNESVKTRVSCGGRGLDSRDDIFLFSQDKDFQIIKNR